MKKLIFVFLLLFAFTAYGADTEVQDLTDITTPALGDDMYIVDDPDGTPDSTKINIGALLGVANDLDASGDVADDSHAHVITNIDSFSETELETQLSDVTAVFTNNVTGDVTVSAGTSAIGAGVIIETDIDGDVDPVDEDFLQYDSTGTNFTWRSDVEVISDLSSAATDWNATGEVAWGNLAAGELTDNTVDFDDFVHDDWGEVTNATGSVVIDDSIAVSSWNLTTPTITTNFTFDSITATAITTEAEGISNDDSDTSIATNAAIIDYVSGLDGLGSNLTSTTNDITSDEGHVVLASDQAAGFNESIQFDFEDTDGKVVVTSPSGATGVRFDSMQLAVGDDTGIGWGNTPDAQIAWNDGTYDSLQLGIYVSEAYQSGIFSFVEYGDIGAVTREPNLEAEHPTLRIFSSDATDDDGWIQFYHNETDGNIDVGSGNINMLDPVDMAANALDCDSNTVTLSTVAGAINMGGATTLEIPNASDPATGTAGMIAVDTDTPAQYGGLEVYAATGAGIIPVLQHHSKTIIDIATVQAIEDAIPLLHVSANWAPHGITIVDIELAADASNSETYVLEEWSAPTTYVSDIESCAFSASTEFEDDGTLADSSIATDSYVMVDLDGTPSSLNFLVVSFTYIINTGGAP